ncbi:hypothetical protein JW899_04925 [Candidatus Uhrbacteria bacterium]|nr:hypothetical protein [Candidatus Uhrbacteria bacterium]
MFHGFVRLSLVISVLFVTAAGCFYVAAGGDDSHFCRSTRFVKGNMPVLPIPEGFCGAVSPKDPRQLPPPPKPKGIEDSVFFRRGGPESSGS